MSTDTIVTEVFETVEADPDAILEAYDVESPEELVATDGKHEATTDPVVDADDETAQALFASLQTIAPPEMEANGTTDDTENADANGSSSGNGNADGKWPGGGNADGKLSGDGNADGTSRDTHRSPGVVESDGSVFVSEPTVVVSSETADSIPDAASNESDSSGALSLVGPDPTTTRVSNDAFGSVDSTTDSTEFQWTEPEQVETSR